MTLLARLLLTYLLHSTLLLAAAALLRVVLRERRLGVQEAVLRAALVGGFVTAGLQVGLGVTSFAGVVRMPAVAEAAAWAPVNRPVSAGRALDGGPVHSASESVGAVPSATDPVPPGTMPTDEQTVADRPSGPWEERVVLAPTPLERAAAIVAASWRELLGAAWAVCAAFALVRLAIAGARLRRLLRDRTPIADGPLVPEAARVAGALGLSGAVPLSAAPHLRVPLATGVLRPEACLPTRAMCELGKDELVALCAHELAHVRRRDPAWVLLARAIEASAPLQPLNSWARRRLQELAECLSDDLAVSASAQPLGLARSLVDVASWTLGDDRLLSAAAAGALSARSRLGHRVERLMNPVRKLERPQRLLLPVATVAVAATAFLVPVVSGNNAVPDDTKPAVEAADGSDAKAAPAPQPRPQPRPQARPKPEPRPREEALARAGESDSRRDAERRLEELTRRIEERAHGQEAEMHKLEAEMQELAARLQPNGAEMERLSRDMEKAAREMSEAVADDFGGGAAGDGGERARTAARRMAEIRAQLDTAAKAMHGDEMRQLGEKARELAERARPTEEERREIERLSRELSRSYGADAHEAHRAMREAMAGSHDAMRQALAGSREAMQQAMQQLRESMEQMRQAMDQAREEMRAASEELRRAHGSEGPAKHRE